VARAVELANAYVRRPLRALTVPEKDEGPSNPNAGATGSGGANNAAGPSGMRVINLLAVAAPQQVQLEVKIAEVSKSLLENLEAGATWKFGSGSWGATLLANFISGSNHSALG